MSINLILGKFSNNDLFRVDLMELPHLFVSYSEPGQLISLYNEVLKQLGDSFNSGQLRWAFAGSSNLVPEAQKGILDSAKAVFLRNLDDEVLPSNRLVFIRTLRDELNKRRKKSLAGSSNQVSLFKPLVVFIDDLLDIVITRRKATGSYFLELLRYGPEYDIHFIMASIRTYHNLVKQLLALESRTENAIWKYGNDGKPLLQHQAAELVITPEDLYFFKMAADKSYTRLFPLNEGQSI